MDKSVDAISGQQLLKARDVLTARVNWYADTIARARENRSIISHEDYKSLAIIATGLNSIDQMVERQEVQKTPNLKIVQRNEM